MRSVGRLRIGPRRAQSSPQERSRFKRRSSLDLGYESASLMRRVNNFTSLAQYILLSGRFSRKVIRILGPVDRDELVKYLRLYKSGRTNDAFESTLKMLQL